MREITVYSKPNCPACRMLKKRFTDLGTEFNEISLPTPEAIEKFHESYPLVAKLPFVVVTNDEQVEDTWMGFEVSKVNKYSK